METEIITYQAITHPVPLEFNNSNSSKGYTRIRLTKEFFIETKSRHSWSELSQADYRYCVSILDSTCPALSIDRDRNDLSWLAALFYDQVIRNKCNFEYYPEAIRPVHKAFVSEGTYIISTSEDKVEFMCPKYAKVTTILRYGILQMSCTCSLSS